MNSNSSWNLEFEFENEIRIWNLEFDFESGNSAAARFYLQGHVEHALRPRNASEAGPLEL